MFEMFKDIEGMKVVVDDMVIHGKTKTYMTPI